MNKKSYVTSIQHLLDELKCIDILITAAIDGHRQQSSSDDNLMRLYGISDNEIDTLLEKSVDALTGNEKESNEPSEELASILRTQTENILEKKRTSLAQGIELRLEKLTKLFRLSPEEINILLISLAPEISVKYQQFYAYLQDDKTRINPSVDLVLRLLQIRTGEALIDKLKKYSLFTNTASLIQSDLICLQERSGSFNQPLLNKMVKVDERIRDYLLGSDQLPERLNDCVSSLVPRKNLDELLLEDTFKIRIQALIQDVDLKQKNLMLYLQGGYGAGKKAIAEGLCQIAGLKLLIVDMKLLARLKPAEFGGKVTGLIREAGLQNAALFIRNFDALIPREQDANDQYKDNEIAQDETLLNLFFNSLTKRPGLRFFSGNAVWEPKGLSAGSSYYRIPVAQPNTLEREQLWRVWQNEYPRLADDVDLAGISDRFQLSPGQIRDALDTATSLSQWRDPKNIIITHQDLNQACRLQSNRQLARLAQNITPHYEWDDLILAPDTISILGEIRTRMTHRALVYEQWGFDRKLAMGKGLHLLFSGPPGTGKTMAADVLANVFEMDLYKIDLSSVVSKYIGETEKNLSEIFYEAETSNAILFFDEADALFGKRTEVKDSNDRHANIEVGYLLQRMEQYSGIVILSTNFGRNMDDAFVRRLHYCVDFPLPEKAERLRIWEKIWPKETPCGPDLDMDFLAERLEISGGYIRNIALAAAFMAAEETGAKQKSSVSMSHLFHATRREYQKMGQILKQSTLSR